MALTPLISTFSNPALSVLSDVRLTAAVRPHNMQAPRPHTRRVDATRAFASGDGKPWASPDRMLRRSPHR